MIYWVYYWLGGSFLWRPVILRIPPIWICEGNVRHGMSGKLDHTWIWYQADIGLHASNIPLMYAADKVDRPVSTAIYFLLPAGSVSRLHRIPCAETWHFYKGEPLTVSIIYFTDIIELPSCYSTPKSIRQLVGMLDLILLVCVCHRSLSFTTMVTLTLLSLAHTLRLASAPSIPCHRTSGLAPSPH